MIKHTLPVLTATVILALLGVYISNNLLVKHVNKQTGLGWFDSTCEASDDSQSRRSCDEVVSSAWGTFPPIPKGTPEEQRHVPRPAPLLGLNLTPRPVALFGMIYFSVMAAWYVAVGRCDYRRRFWHLVPLALNTAGVCGVVFFAYVMFFTDLEAWCPWCLVTHVINVLMLVGTILLWPRKRYEVAEATRLAGPVAGGGDASTDTADAEPKSTARRKVAPTAPPAEATAPAGTAATRPANPTGHLVFVTAVLALSLAAAQLLYYEFADAMRGKHAFQGAFGKCEEEIKKVQESASTLYALYEANPKVNIPIRPDDPIKNARTGKLLAVVFSDFGCPHCRQFAKYMSETVEPMFGDSLKVVFKHYPASNKCNKYLKTPMHPGACPAAMAAEAARKLGGSDAFWKAHDLLFAASKKQRNSGEYYGWLARELGFDPVEFAKTMTSDEVRERIAEDIDVASAIKMRGTPSLYVSGRLVPSFARREAIYWEEVKRRFDAIMARREQLRQHSRGTPQPDRPTQSMPPPATEDSPDQSIVR